MDVMTQGIQEATERMRALYGENKKITDGKYDKALAAKCVNGTFDGKKTDENVIAYKGIPLSVAAESAGGLCAG